MQWGFTRGSGGSRQQWVIDVPDGTYPPEVGEAINLRDGPPGSFKIKSRQLEVHMPNEGGDREFTWGWSFVIEEV